MEFRDPEFSSTGELKSFLTTQIIPDLEKWNIVFGYLTGSWAENDNKSWSDIDLCFFIDGFENLNDHEQVLILSEIQVHLSMNSKLDRVEVSILQGLPLHVQFSMIKKGIIIFDSDPKRRTDYIEYLLPRYWDHRIWYERYLDQILEDNG